MQNSHGIYGMMHVVNEDELENEDDEDKIPEIDIITNQTGNNNIQINRTSQIIINGLMRASTIRSAHTVSEA